MEAIEAQDVDSSQSGMASTSRGPFDLLLLVDASASMQYYLEALNGCLDDIISISTLTGAFDRIGVLAYRDYGAKNLTEWSGWCLPLQSTDDPDIVDQQAVLSMAKSLDVEESVGSPSAIKTGLAHAHHVMREDATTVILLYTDSPPHFATRPTPAQIVEVGYLSDKESYGGFGPLFVDWVSAAKILQQGAKKAIVFSFIGGDVAQIHSPYLYLSTMTNGRCFQIVNPEARKISKVTVGVLLQWMGFDYGLYDEHMAARGYRYRSLKGIHKATSESNTTLLSRFITRTRSESLTDVLKNTQITSISRDSTGKASLYTFSDRYLVDEQYRGMVITQLRHIIETNIACLSIHPAFGSL